MASQSSRVWGAHVTVPRILGHFSVNVQNEGVRGIFGEMQENMFLTQFWYVEFECFV